MSNSDGKSIFSTVNVRGTSYNHFYLQGRRSLLKAENVEPYLFPSNELPLDKRTSDSIARMSLLALELGMQRQRIEEERCYRKVLLRKQGWHPLGLATSAAGSGTGRRASSAEKSSSSSKETALPTSGPSRANVSSTFLTVDHPVPDLPDDIKRYILKFLPVTRMDDLPLGPPECMVEAQAQHKLWCALLLVHKFLRPAIAKAAARGYGGIFALPFLPIWFGNSGPFRNETAEASEQRIESMKAGMPAMIQRFIDYRGGPEWDLEFPDLCDILENMGYVARLGTDSASLNLSGWSDNNVIIWDEELKDRVERRERADNTDFYGEKELKVLRDEMGGNF